MTQKQYVPIESEDYITGLKEDESIFTVEFIQEETGGPMFSNKEFIFKKFLNNDFHIEGLQKTENSILAEIRDIKFPDTPIRTDISRGFFRTKADAAYEFTKMLRVLYEASLKEFHEKFGQYEEALGIKRS